jgi:hypothetical protein
MKFQSLLEYINDHKSRTDTIHGWEVVKTKHGQDRENERHAGELPGGHHEFMHKVIKKISGVKNPRSGEFMYHSAKHNQAAVLNVDHEKKQLRVITVLPKGRTTPKPGTQKFMVEGVEQELECIVLHDTEFDEAMDQFVTEELGMSLDDVLDESVVSSKEHHEKFAASHKAAMERAKDEINKSLHTRGMNLHLKAAAANNAASSERANEFTQSVRNGTAGVPGMDNVPKHIKDDEMNRRYSSPGAKFRK